MNVPIVPPWLVSAYSMVFFASCAADKNPVATVLLAARTGFPTMSFTLMRVGIVIPADSISNPPAGPIWSGAKKPAILNGVPRTIPVFCTPCKKDCCSPPIARSSRPVGIPDNESRASIKSLRISNFAGKSIRASNFPVRLPSISKVPCAIIPGIAFHSSGVLDKYNFTT